MAVAVAVAVEEGGDAMIATGMDRRRVAGAEAVLAEEEDVGTSESETSTVATHRRLSGHLRSAGGATAVRMDPPCRRSTIGAAPRPPAAGATTTPADPRSARGAIRPRPIARRGRGGGGGVGPLGRVRERELLLAIAVAARRWPGEELLPLGVAELLPLAVPGSRNKAEARRRKSRRQSRERRAQGGGGALLPAFRGGCGGGRTRRRGHQGPAHDIRLPARHAGRRARHLAVLPAQGRYIRGARRHPPPR